MTEVIRLPEISENVKSGDVIEVLVKVGDLIEQEQPIVELETENAVLQQQLSDLEGRLTGLEVANSSPSSQPVHLAGFIGLLLLLIISLIWVGWRNGLHRINTGQDSGGAR